MQPGVKKLELFKTFGPDGQAKGLGFSIAGGIGNEHYPGDTGIFVTRIIEKSPAYYNGLLQKGDQILAVCLFFILPKFQVDNTIFDNVTHQFAVETLKSTGNQVTILYLKNPHPDLEAAAARLDDSRSLQGFTSGLEPSNTVGPEHHFAGSQSHLAYPSQTIEIGSDPRLVTLRKSDGGLGFNIVGGEDREPIYVSHVLPGGVADLSGNVKKVKHF